MYSSDVSIGRLSGNSGSKSSSSLRCDDDDEDEDDDDDDEVEEEEEDDDDDDLVTVVDPAELDHAVARQVLRMVTGVHRGNSQGPGTW